jgi:lipoprotein-anchoring transpeptidase ErfK/SrfK
MTHAMKIARTGTFALIAAAALSSAPVLAQSQSQMPYYAPNVTSDAAGESAEVPAHLRRQTVGYATQEAPGTIVIDTPNTFLYYVLGGGKAIRYGIGVGREGFAWSGVKTVERKAEWPDWIPPAEMLERQPYLPRFMTGGPANPLGARAMYLAGTVYRIHGTNSRPRSARACRAAASAWSTTT